MEQKQIIIKGEYSRRGFWKKYAICFIVINLLRFAPLLVRGKSNIFNGDAMVQYLYSLSYLGSWLREGIMTFFQGEGFTFPMWDLSVGMGQDVMTTLHYYGFTDPLSWLSVFFHEKNMWIFYLISQTVKLFFAGAGFATFCFYHKRDEHAVLLGTVIYTFCGWTTILGIQYIQFLTPMIYFPLILLGVDKIYNERKYGVYISVLAVAGITNFYFFYMMCIFTLFYVIIRYFDSVKTMKIKVIMSWFLRFFVSTLIGVSMAAIVLLPVLNVLFSSERMSAGYENSTLFPLIYYLSLPSKIMSFGQGYGVVPIALFALWFVFHNKGRNIFKIIAICFALIFCIPYLQKALNGFSYVSERWGWAWVMFAAFICVEQYHDFWQIDKKNRRVLIVLFVLLILLKGAILREIDAGLIGLLLIGGVVLILHHEKITVKSKEIILLMVSGTAMVVSAWEIYNDETRVLGYVYDMDFSELSNASFETPLWMAASDTDVQAGRVEAAYSLNRLEENVSLLMHNYGTSHYYSLTTDTVSDFYNKIWNNVRNDYQYNGFESKAELDTLFATRYVVCNATQEFPAYYKLLKSYDNGYALFENQAALPLVYTYSKYMPYDVWDEMEPEDKQSALLQMAILEESTLPMAEYIDNNDTLEYKITVSDDIRMKDDEIEVLKDGASMTIEIEGSVNVETYVKIADISYEGAYAYSKIELKSQNDEKSIIVLPPTHYQSSGKDDYLCNLGYSDFQRTSVELKFNMAGRYSYSELELIEQIVEDVPQKAAFLSAGIEDEFIIKNNTISGNVLLTEPKLLCVAVPYSEGFSCYVDGERVDVLKVNSIFLGVELTEGEHNIEFRYRTPYLLVGTLISLLGMIGFVVLMICSKKRNDKAQ